LLHLGEFPAALEVAQQVLVPDLVQHNLADLGGLAVNQSDGPTCVASSACRDQAFVRLPIGSWWRMAIAGPAGRSEL
jgi:hypothetical protein